MMRNVRASIVCLMLFLAAATAAGADDMGVRQARQQSGSKVRIDPFGMTCALPRSPMSVLYLGDSLTDFDRGSNHVDRLQSRLDAARFGKISIHNYAIGGDYIDRMLARLNGVKGSYALERYNGLWDRQYDLAFVSLGHNDTRAWSTNDFATPEISADRVRSGYKELISILKAKGVKRIVLVSSASSNFELTSRKAAERLAAMKSGKAKPNKVVRYGDPAFLESFNAVLEELAAADHEVEYLDVYTGMKLLPDKGDYLNPTDGVHLSPRGHAYFAEREFEYFMRGLR